MAQEDYADAVSYYEQALAVDLKVGHSALKANVLSNFATARAALGETAAAGALHCEALSLKQEGGDLRTLSGILEAVAFFLANQDHSEQDHSEAACRIWGAAEKLREDSDSPRPLREQDAYDQATAKVRQSLESSSIEAAWAEGREMPMAQAIAYAIRETETLRSANSTL